MSCTSELTIEELIAYLKRSDLPAILVEGRDDMTIYRWIEDSSISCLGAIIPCGGRSQVIDIAQRQGELGQKRVAFLVDSDSDAAWGDQMSIPNTIWTAGYAIENDLFATGVITNLMTQQERDGFSRVVESLTLWFLHCVLQIKEGSPARLCRHSRDILDHDTIEFREELEVDQALEEKYADACERIRAHPLVYVRGKNLFDSALFFLSGKGRKSKYSRQNLYELCAINHAASPELTQRLNQLLRIIEPPEEN
jgi:hypothetical protein